MQLATLDEVLDVNVGSLSRADLLDVLEEAERGKAALEARCQQALARLLDLDSSGKDYVAEEVAAVLRLAPATALGRLHQAGDLAARLPRLLDLLAIGEISFLHLKAAAEATRDLTPELAAQVEHQLLDRAGELTVGEFRAAARRTAARLDPRTEEEQHADRHAQRRVELYPDEHGMAGIWAYLSADRAAALMAALTAHAETLEDEPGCKRTMDQKRADVLADLADFVGFAGPVTDDTTAQTDAAADTDGDTDAAAETDTGCETDAGCESETGTDTDTEPAPGTEPASPAPMQPAAGKRRAAPGPGVQVVVALSTLLGCDQYPGELVGHGPIPAALAREIAADPTGTWQRLVTDAAGRLLDASRSYSPPPRLRAHVIARDITCRFPGCRRKAAGCEIDHVVAYSDGGPTAEPNLHALCARHHHLKHEAGWQVQRRGDGTTEWTTPTGRRIDKPPDDPLAA